MSALGHERSFRPSLEEFPVSGVNQPDRPPADPPIVHVSSEFSIKRASFSCSGVARRSGRIHRMNVRFGAETGQSARIESYDC